MNDDLTERVGAELATLPPDAVLALAMRLVEPERDMALLYYGSTLRTGDLTGILDFYRLTRRPHRQGLRGLLERFLWPEVSYHEIEVDGAILRAKVATLPFATFRRAAEGRTLDTTIWARFVQPVQLVWRADAEAGADVLDAVIAAIVTAARYAAALGPASGPPEAFWTALFRRTYAAEFRVEDAGRADTVLASASHRYAMILPLAWRHGGVRFAEGAYLRPMKHHLPGWRLRKLAGKPLNVARLAKAAFTFDGATRYAVWKIQRHTGIEIPVTPFAERHPLLAAPGAWWRLRKRQAEARRAR